MLLKALTRPIITMASTLFLVGAVGYTAPVALWVSQPVAPGQTVMVFGDGFGGCKNVRVDRLPDRIRSKRSTVLVTPSQVSPKCVMFTLPASQPGGVFRASIATVAGLCEILVNRPQLTWVQGDAG